jgi:alpha/beta hydrolase fold
VGGELDLDVQEPTALEEAVRMDRAALNSARSADCLMRVLSGCIGEERYAFGVRCSEVAMRRLVKIFAYIAAGLLATILLVASIFVLRPAYTPPITSAQGHVSVASLEKIKLGGVDQYILIRGRSVSNPVVLFLHGGPGMPMMYLAHKFQRPLEEAFTVVQWDRRGAGKSYDPNIPADTIRVSQEISDTRDLVNLLRKRFHQQRIYLVGHSYGSYLGMLVIKRYPRLFKAYVGIGQMACSDSQSRAIQDRWIRERAIASNNAEALKEVNSKGRTIASNGCFSLAASCMGRPALFR